MFLQTRPCALDALIMVHADSPPRQLEFALFSLALRRPEQKRVRIRRCAFTNALNAVFGVSCCMKVNYHVTVRA